MSDREKNVRRIPDAADLFAGIRAGDRSRLARAVTLVESRAPRHRSAARELMRLALPHAGGAIRVGLTGVPGAGKSTFIECLGMHLLGRAHRIAVLAVDPSSTVSGGSILGDKTRMERLAGEEGVFIRPSPSGAGGGGVAARTREAMLLCEAAGYDVVLVETVGVGQGETAVRTMTDFFLLLQIAGGGDELQGIKKGVIELADAIVVNKADGANADRAERTRGEFERVLHFLQPFTEGWTPVALTCSALEGRGVDGVWEVIERFRREMTANGVLEERRARQNVDWFHSLLRQRVMERFTEANGERIREMESSVREGTLPVSVALDRIFGDEN